VPTYRRERRSRSGGYSEPCQPQENKWSHTHNYLLRVGCPTTKGWRRATDPISPSSPSGQPATNMQPSALRGRGGRSSAHGEPGDLGRLGFCCVCVCVSPDSVGSAAQGGVQCVCVGSGIRTRQLYSTTTKNKWDSNPPVVFGDDKIQVGFEPASCIRRRQNTSGIRTRQLYSAATKNKSMRWGRVGQRWAGQGRVG